MTNGTDSPADESSEQKSQHELRTSPNPNRKRDYICRIQGIGPGSAALITLSYVPGKLLIRPDAFADYLATFPAAASLEALVLDIVDDINNEVVPRWVEVRAEETLPGGTAHVVIAEDREPKWSNPELLARLG